MQPWAGGSHQAFVDQWRARSGHDFDVLELPARHWKWRMRHAAVHFAGEVAARLEDGGQLPWDVVFATDLMALAEFRGLAPPSVAALPTVLYQHETQLAYPSSGPKAEHAGDLHFAMTNFTSALAADAVWFNSQFHLDTFFQETEGLLRRMPDFAPLEQLTALRTRASVQRPGVDGADPSSRPNGAPLRVGWAARWEHDKNPEEFFAALEQWWESCATPFELVVLGESFAEVPACFADAEQRFADQIVHWGFAPSRQQYLELLSSCDVVVSTARHEFFGLSAAEALCCGCWLLAPDRLAYPELVELAGSGELYGATEALVGALGRLAGSGAQLRGEAACRAAAARSALEWSRAAPRLDGALDEVRGSGARRFGGAG